MEKEKEKKRCPHCGVEHTKKNEYCSHACRSWDAIEWEREQEAMKDFLFQM